MISDRKKEERILRKKRIVNGALKVFNELGIEKTTMDEIALESGFGKATLYYYFSSKDEVFVEIMEGGWRKLWEGIEARIVAELGPKQKFMGIVKSNAYGHDLETAVKALNDSVDGFGVVRMEEAQMVRQSSSKPILMMQGVFEIV